MRCLVGDHVGRPFGQSFGFHEPCRILGVPRQGGQGVRLSAKAAAQLTNRPRFLLCYMAAKAQSEGREGRFLDRLRGGDREQ